MNTDTGHIYRTQADIDAAIARGENIEMIGPRIAELDKAREFFRDMPIKQYNPRADLEEAITRIGRIAQVHRPLWMPGRLRDRARGGWGRLAGFVSRASSAVGLVSGK
jgi:hypothetical protein